jgi:hypothetical protein
MNHLEEWILFFLIQREKLGLETKGHDLFWQRDVIPLAEAGMVELEQSNAIPSLQKEISASTVIRVTDKGRNYFER